MTEVGARSPRPRRLDASRAVVVVGGGIAGLAAATVLAERGAAVTVVEALPYLGGRAGAWAEPGPDGDWQIERGFHAFFRQYYNLRALLRRVDPELRMLRRLDDYPVLAPDGASERFSHLRLPPPWNALELIARSQTLRLRDLRHVHVGAGLEMLAWDRSATWARVGGRTAASYLDALRLPSRGRAMLFDIFAHSFFVPEQELSAAEMLEYFHFYFLRNPDGLVFDMLDGPLSTRVWQPLRRQLEARGARFLLEAPARALRAEGAGYAVDLDGETLRGDAVVLACDVAGLQALVEPSGLGEPDWRRRVAALRPTWPYAVLRLWLDGRPRDRSTFAAIAACDPLDSIALYDQVCEDAAAWAGRTGGSVVELHAYAARPDDDEATLRAGLLAGLHRLYPETATMRIVHERFGRGRDAPAFDPGCPRPPVPSGRPGLVLAGDLAEVPFPCALMERAASSGFLAANALLEPWGAAAEPLRSVPPRGVLAGGAMHRVLRRVWRS